MSLKSKIEAGGAETVRLKQVTDAQNTKTRKAGPGGAKLSVCPLLSSATKSPLLNFLARHSNTLGLLAKVPRARARKAYIPGSTGAASVNCLAFSRSTYFWIFPVEVFGSSSWTNLPGHM